MATPDHQMQATGARGVEPGRFRAAMAGVCAPVSVVTTAVDGAPAGATVSSLASLSMNPPLISVAFSHTSAVLARILTARRFGVNLLSAQQEELAVLFASRGTDRFTTTPWVVSDGLPRLLGAAGWLACELHRGVEAGDHLMLFGLITNCNRHCQAPLIYADRTFGTHSVYTRRPRPAISDLIAACAR